MTEPGAYTGRGSSHAEHGAIIRWSACVLIAILSGPASARDYTLGTLSIDRPWSRELPPVAANGAAYFRIENRAKSADYIVSAHSPIAERAEIHTHEMKEGLMRMRRVNPVEAPAQGEVSFEPGGLHVMLFGLKKPLVSGESFPLTLEFLKAGKIEVTVEIEGSAAADRSGAGGHRH